MIDEFKEAVNRKYPEGVVFVSAISGEGKPNVMPAGWFMFTSHHPLMVAVSIGHERYTNQLIKEQGELVIAFPSFEMAADVIITGRKSGRDHDKLGKTSLHLIHAQKVRPYLIAGALANLECILQSYHETGDHTIFVGEVVACRVEGLSRKRLMNFGMGDFAVAMMDPEAMIRLES